MAYLGLYPRKMAAGGGVDNPNPLLYTVPSRLNPTFAQDLAAAGLTGSRGLFGYGPDAQILFDPREDPADIALVKAIAASPGAPPATRIPPEVLSFLTTQDLPGLPGV